MWNANISIQWSRQGGKAAKIWDQISNVIEFWYMIHDQFKFLNKIQADLMFHLSLASKFWQIKEKVILFS